VLLWSTDRLRNALGFLNEVSFSLPRLLYFLLFCEFFIFFGGLDSAHFSLGSLDLLLDLLDLLS